MRMPLLTLRELLDYHYSRRNMVYDFCAELKPEDFTRDTGAGWKSIRTTLLHCLEAEEHWIQYRLQGRGRPDYDPADFPDVTGLRRLAEEVRQRTEAYVATLTEDDPDVERSHTYSGGAIARYNTGQVFMHVITHDTHHRGQVLVLARQMGYAPPEVDLI